MNSERTNKLRTEYAKVKGKLLSCTQKERYSYQTACKICRERNRMPDRRYNIVPYHCPYCGKYHVGKYHENSELSRKIIKAGVTV